MLLHYLAYGPTPIDKNCIENQIRLIAIGRKNWLVADSLSSGKRMAVIMSLIDPVGAHEWT